MPQLITNIESPFEALCQSCNLGSDKDLFTALVSLSHYDLDRVFWKHKAYSNHKNVHGSDLRLGELRPYLPSIGKKVYASGGMPSAESLFYSQDRVWNYIDGIKHRLLYCHGIASENPIIRGLSLAQRIGLSYGLEPRNNILANIATFAIATHRLVKAGALVFVHDDWFGAEDNVIPEIEAEVKNAINGADFGIDDANEISRSITINEEYAAKIRSIMQEDQGAGSYALRMAAATRIARALTCLHLSPEKITPYFPFRQDVRAFRYACDHSLLLNQTRTEGLELLQQNYFRELSCITLPGIKNLSISDIVSIRDDKSFIRWRNDIENALKRVGEAEITGASSQVEREKEFKSYLIFLKDNLNKDFSHSRTLEAARSASIVFGVGVIAPVLTELFDPQATATALRIGVGSAAVGAATEYITSRHLQHAKGSIYKHYASLIG